MKRSRGSLVVLLIGISVNNGAFGFSPMFEKVASRQRREPSKREGVEIELPNFDMLFDRIQSVSPLAKVAIDQNTDGNLHGFEAITETNEIPWKSLERKKSRNQVVHQIDKVDNFQGLSCPMIRMRATIEGPCNGAAFAEFIMNTTQRASWDPSIAQVYERYPVKDLDAVNIAMGLGKYGDCSKLGVGYCQTKSYLAVSGREQLTLCGIQDFADKSCLIWGTEMEEWHNHLLPPGKRLPRSKSHLFSVALVPRNQEKFDVEYCLQINVGGIPSWVTTPILIETIKNMFRCVKDFFGGDAIQNYIVEQSLVDEMKERNSILMTP